MSRISRFVVVILLVVVPSVSVSGSDDPWQSLAEQAATQGISQESIDSAQAAIRDDSSSSPDASVWGSWIQGKADGLGYTASGTDGGEADEAADAPNSDDQFVDIDVAEAPEGADSNDDAPSASPSSDAPQAQTPAPLSQAPGAPSPNGPQAQAPAPQAQAPTPQAQAPVPNGPQAQAPAPNGPQTQAPAPQAQAPAPNGPQTQAPLNPQSPMAGPALAPTPNNNKVAQPQAQAPQAQAPAAGAPTPQVQAHRGLFSILGH